jgi:hypothetical protein
MYSIILHSTFAEPFTLDGDTDAGSDADAAKRGTSIESSIMDQVRCL